MHKKTLSLVVPLAVILTASLTFAMEQRLDDIGKSHFMNPKFAGGQRACNDCHPNGRNLEKAGAKTKFSLMGKEVNSLEGAINLCITNAIMGKAIPEDSDEMKGMVSYIKSLGAKAAARTRALRASHSLVSFMKYYLITSLISNRLIVTRT